MAFNPLPQMWLENLTDNGTDITIPIATFPEMVASEIDSATGDIRKVVYAICEKLWSRWNALATADKCTKMTLNKSASVDTATGIVTNTYTITIKALVISQDVAPEA